MGSFCELVLAADFRPDVPDEVLAAFASARVGEDGPPLPPPVASDPWWEPDDPDLAAELAPWARPWGEHLGKDMSGVTFPGATGVSLVWNEYTERWNLTVRSVWKSTTPWIAEMITWMAPFLCPLATPTSRSFLGYLLHEYDDRPTLIWHDGSAFVFEGIEDAAM